MPAHNLAQKPTRLLPGQISSHNLQQPKRLLERVLFTKLSYRTQKIKKFGHRNSIVDLEKLSADT